MGDLVGKTLAKSWFSILTSRLALEEHALADVMIAPVIPMHHEMSARIIAEYLEALPKMRALFAGA